MKYIILFIGVTMCSPAYAKNQFIVTPKGSRAAGQSSSIVGLGLMMVRFNKDTKRLYKQQGYVVKTEMGKKEVEKSLGEHFLVEPDRIVKTSLSCSRPDPGECPTYTTIPEQKNWGYGFVNAEQANVVSSGKDIVVAVIDTGVDLCHPDIGDRLVPGWDYVDDDDKPHDLNGHGTHVAGIVAAIDNQTDGLGVSQARIMPIRVLDGNGSGRISDVINGIIWAADHGAHFANLSLGGGYEPTNAERNAIEYAQLKGMTLLIAAGNESKGQLSCPACLAKEYPSVKAIVALDPDGTIASYSNYGPGTSWALPGTDIVSLKLGGRLISHSGTSMATPFAAGIYALAKKASRPLKDNGSILDPQGNQIPKLDAAKSVGL